MAAEGRREGERRTVTDGVGDLGQAEIVGAQVVAGEGHPPFGTSVQTGRPYDNRFVSIVTITDRKVTHWRDYLDPVAVFNAAGWPQIGDADAST